MRDERIRVKILVDMMQGPQGDAARRVLQKLLLIIPSPETVSADALRSYICHNVEADPFYGHRDKSAVQEALFNSFRQRYPEPK